jgi:hypothetical protein
MNTVLAFQSNWMVYRRVHRCWNSQPYAQLSSFQHHALEYILQINLVSLSLYLTVRIFLWGETKRYTINMNTQSIILCEMNFSECVWECECTKRDIYIMIYCVLYTHLQEINLSKSCVWLLLNASQRVIQLLKSFLHFLRNEFVSLQRKPNKVRHD